MRLPRKTLGKVLVVGGGVGQVPLIKRAAKAGYFVAVSDLYRNPPGRVFADSFLQIDVRDTAATLNYARSLGITAVCSDQSDLAVPTVATIAEELGLAGIGRDVAIRFTDKASMRRSLEVLGPQFQPQYEVVEPRSTLKSPASQLSTDLVIVKPSRSQGSRGVSLVSQDDISSAIHRAAAFQAADDVFLVEEFIPGEEFAVESLVIDGVVRVLATSRKTHYEGNEVLDRVVEFPSELDNPRLEALLRLNSSVIGCLGLTNGLTHGEYKFRSDGTPVLIEIAARGAGGEISSRIVRFMSGVDTTDFVFRFATNQPVPPLPTVENSNLLARLEFFQCENRPFRAFHISDSAKMVAESLVVNGTAGSVYNGLTDSSSRLGYFVIFGSSREELLTKRREVMDGIKIVYGDEGPADT